MGINDRSWQEIEQDEIVQKFRQDLYRKKDKIWRGKLLSGFNDYIRRKKRGDFTYQVDEWDAFELERDRDKIRELDKKNIKGEIKVMDKRVLVRLSKNYNVVEVEASDILEVDDFKSAKDWVFNEAVSLLGQIPDEGFGQTDKKPRTPNSYTKEVVGKQEQPSVKPQQSYVTKADIHCGVNLSAGQIGVAIKRINKGEITLAEVNAIQTYDQAQTVIFGK